MADDDGQQTLVINEDVSLSDDISEIEDLNALAQRKTKPKDILQKAFDEVSANSTQEQSALQDKVKHLSDHSYVNSATRKNTAPENSQLVEKNLDLQCLQSSSEIVETSADKMGVNNDVISQVGDTANEIFTDSGSLPISENTTGTDNSVPSSDSQLMRTLKVVAPPEATSTPQVNPLDIIARLKLPPKQSSDPIGSANNPIQIIQHGDSYHPTQILTQAQLQQISHVLQTQQAKKVAQNGGRSILYDPSTNTRIVCRVVYPSELQSKGNTTTPKPQMTSNRGRGRPRKLSSRQNEDDEKSNSLLSKEEREEKKKHRPRTRSGRISKPPSYMVKDYKRIHHLDFNEEPYDDSDGGYSDYHVSDEESNKWVNKTPSPGVTTAKQRNYSCQSCSKAYIGRGGLSRHYRLNPSHGSLPEGEDTSTQDENSNSSFASSILSSSGGNTTNQSNSSASQCAVKFDGEGAFVAQKAAVESNNSISENRKSELNELLKKYSTSELINVLLPKVANDVSVWDLLLLKCEKEKSKGTNIVEMLKECDLLLKHVKQVSQHYLSPASMSDIHTKMVINLNSKEVAAALSIDTGAYVVKESSLLLPHNNNTLVKPLTNTSMAMELSREVASPLVKRRRVTSNAMSIVEDVTRSLPEQILSEVHDNDSLGLSIVTDNFAENAELHEQDTQLLNATLASAHSQMNAKSVFDMNAATTSLVQLTNSTTTVTPSSLSSGCLSAVDTLKSERCNNFTLDAQKLQMYAPHAQMSQLILRDDAVATMDNFTISSENTLIHPSSHIQMNKAPDLVQQVTACTNEPISEKQTYHTLMLNANADIFPPLENQSALVNGSQTSASNISLLKINNPGSACEVTTGQNIVSMENNFSQNIAGCLQITDVANTQPNSGAAISSEALQTCLTQEVGLHAADVQESRDLQVTHNEIIANVSKPSDESSAVLRHLLLPDGQVIGIWSSAMEKQPSGDLLPQGLLPGNLIILQNPDGSLQVPTQQGIPLETLQTLVSVDPAIQCQADSQNSTPVQPM